ncbi:MAG: hypothetical protein RLZZ245_936, partial [Verrucomicrobiota bacterium]
MDRAEHNRPEKAGWLGLAVSIGQRVRHVDANGIDAGFEILGQVLL